MRLTVIGKLIFRQPECGKLTLKMTSAQVVNTSVTNNSSFQNFSQLDNHTIQTKIFFSFTC